jgi:hypothetical protein
MDVSDRGMEPLLPQQTTTGDPAVWALGQGPPERL